MSAVGKQAAAQPLGEAAATPEGPAVAVKAAVAPPEPQDLTGLWMKDKEASDSMTPTCDLMELGKLMRFAISLIKGIEIRMSPDTFNLDVLSGVLWFKIKEKYPMTGEVQKQSRRDMRRGGNMARVERSPSSGGILIKSEWKVVRMLCKLPLVVHKLCTLHMPLQDPVGGTMEDHFYDPVGGTMEDHFYIASPGVLHKDTTLWVKGQTVKERSVYRLKK